VHPYLGAAIEGIATLLCRLASKALSEKGSQFCCIIDSFIGTSLVVAGKLTLKYTVLLQKTIKIIVRTKQFMLLIMQCFQLSTFRVVILIQY